MTVLCVVLVAVLALANVWSTQASSELVPCDVRARTDAGWVCGLRRWAENGATYASFRGLPYAKQPVGELRFKELEPSEPWEHDYDARVEGPICFQKDILYKKLMQPQNMSEECIYANIHVPYKAFPINYGRQVPQLQPADNVEPIVKKLEPKKGLPILVFIHGGGFAFGSGDTDLHGPEYLVSRDVIVMTFNYRLNVPGFLSLNTDKIPGNAGLRDQITFLRWVQRNAEAFGGNPDNVTIAGQSVGSIAAHILTLSKAAVGLFKRAILMSGLATSGIYSPSPAFAKLISSEYLMQLGITSTDPEEIHQQLIEMPAEKMNEANTILLDKYGLTTFVPVVETPVPGVTTVLDDYPDVLIAKGRGKDIPLIIGYTDAECEVFRNRFTEYGVLDKIKAYPLMMATNKFLFTKTQDVLKDIARQVDTEYFNKSLTMDNLIKMCSDANFEYPALDFSIKRASLESAPVYLYRFIYESDQSVIKKAFGLKYKGAAHIEDLTYIFRSNSIAGNHTSFPPRNPDDRMKYWMTTFFKNFVQNGEPVTINHKPPHWPPVATNKVVYQEIEEANEYNTKKLNRRQKHLIKFFNSLESGNGIKMA